MTITWKGAHPNNFMVGRSGQKIEYIVCHWIVGSLASADATFQNKDRIASATYGVGGKAVHQYVRDEDTAYANGNWQSNLRSISIEHEGGPNLPISDATYETSAQLIAEKSKQYNIPLDRAHIRKHNEVSDKATQCPGTLDLDRLINRAKEILKPTPPPVLVITDQTRIPQLNNMEVQEIRSKLNDLERDLKGLRDHVDEYKKIQLQPKEDEVIVETVKTYPSTPSATPKTPPVTVDPVFSGMLVNLLQALKKKLGL